MPTEPPTPDDRGAETPSVRRYAGMGTELAGAVCGLTLAGYWFDRHFQTGNKGVVTGAIIGIVGGGYNFIREAMALSKETVTDIHDGHHDHAGRGSDNDQE